MMTRTVRHRWAVTAVATSLMAGLAVTTTAAPAAAVEGGQPAILQLGDSYASGEGGGWKGNSNTSFGNRSGTDMAAYQENGTWKYDPHRVYNDASYWNYQDSWADDCHESLHAPIRSLSNSHPDDFIMLYNFACSGAHNRNLWRLEDGGVSYNTRLPQIHTLGSAVVPGHDVKLVAISAGGNDSGFGDAVRLCLAAWGVRYLKPFSGNGDGKCRDNIRDDVLPKVSDMYYNLAKTVDKVRAQLASDGQPADSYRIVLQGYPMILPTASDDWSYPEDTIDNHCYINRDDAEWINQFFLPRLNRMVRAVADEKGVGFIDQTDAFVGHRLCEYDTLRGNAAAASSSRAEWVRFVDVHVASVKTLWSIIEALAIENFNWPLYDETITAILNPQRHVSESFHPNYWGQQALGKCLSLYYHNTSAPAAKVRCYNGGGQTGTTNQMAIASLPFTPVVVDNPNPDIAIPGGGFVQREIILPDYLPVGSHIQPFLDLEHPRKGQLSISISHPSTGTIMTLRKPNLNDGGAWTDGRWTLDYNHSIFWPPPPPKDPSGRWLLTIWDTVDDQYSGVFKSFDMRVY